MGLLRSLLKELNQKPVAYYPLYRNLTGTLQGGILLSQMMYWFAKKDKFWKTDDEFRAETNLTDHEMRTAKKTVCNLPFITKTREQIPAITFYKLDWDVYEKTISEFIKNGTVCRKSTNKKRDKSEASSVCRKSTNCTVENQRTNTKNTTETTYKRLSKDNHIDSVKSNKKQGSKSNQSCSKNKSCSKIKKHKSKHSCSKNRKLPKIKKHKNEHSCSKNKSCPKQKYKHSPTDLRNYIELLSHGITKHGENTKARIDSIDKLHALFDSRCKPPYHPTHIPHEFIDYEWSIDDLIEIFEFQMENAVKFNMKPVRSIGKFIFSEGFNGHKSWSPLLYWAQKMMKTDDSLTIEGEKLFKVMSQNKIKGVQELDSSIINRVSEELKEVEKKYTFLDSTSAHNTYRAGILSVFVKYIKERSNKLSFELVYITKKGFVDEFLHIAIKRNILKKKNGRKGVNE